MQPQTSKGFTLIELATTISILAILACATPSLLQSIEKIREKSELFELMRLLQAGRSNAVTSSHVTTLCGSSDGIHCSSDWDAPTILVFEDGDENHAISVADKIIQRVSFSNARWHWRGSNRPYLRFRADGTPIEWGRFTRCPADKNALVTPQLVLNYLGRPYTTETSKHELQNTGLCG